LKKQLCGFASFRRIIGNSGAERLNLHGSRMDVACGETKYGEVYRLGWEAASDRWRSRDRD
jgi:hypothetical protein